MQKIKRGMAIAKVGLHIAKASSRVHGMDDLGTVALSKMLCTSPWARGPATSSNAAAFVV